MSYCSSLSRQVPDLASYGSVSILFLYVLMRKI
nr:MAG TPA: hypothetical protein [Caudoviricetes sp.]